MALLQSKYGSWSPRPILHLLDVGRELGTSALQQGGEVGASVQQRGGDRGFSPMGHTCQGLRLQQEQG